MWKFNTLSVAILASSLLTNTSLAQEVYLLNTNGPNTKLEAFEAQTGKTIVKGISQIGTVATTTAVVSIRCKESIEAGTGFREYGISIGIREDNREEETTLVDYDELESLLGGIEYLINFDVNATSLSSIHILFTTKGQLRISGFSGNRNPGNVQIAVSNQFTRSRILLTSVQLAELKIKILEAKGRLDVLRKNAP